MTRRHAIKIAGALAATAASVPSVIGQGFTDFEFRALASGSFPFKLPSLPYSVDALEPYISATTMTAHHGNADFVAKQWHFKGTQTKQFNNGYHATLVAELNKSLGLDTAFYMEQAKKYRIGTSAGYALDSWLENMMKESSKIPEGIRSAVIKNAGGHYNHSMFWRMMKRSGGGIPEHELARAIERYFGSFDSFKGLFSEAAVNLFGSGWVWLTATGAALRIESTIDEKTPLSLGREVLLGIDLWEHAYYLGYQNKRADYVGAWWNVVDWDFVAERYAKCKA